MVKKLPFSKRKSDLDIELLDGTGDQQYLNILYEKLDMLFDLVKPDFVFYLSGVDILETDKLGRLNVTVEGCKLRDQMVLVNALKVIYLFNVAWEVGIQKN